VCVFVCVFVLVCVCVGVGVCVCVCVWRVWRHQANLLVALESQLLGTRRAERAAR
jgi:hypothetical protein